MGIDENTRVVAYDDADSMFASRLWWALRYYGHERVFVLDGGWKKWIAENRPTTDVVPEFEQKRFVPAVNESLRATGEDIRAKLESGNVQLIDVRSPVEFAGEASRAEQKGHIPGAINLPRKTIVADDATLSSKDKLKSHFANLGITLDAPDTVIYCNSGVSASYAMVAMLIAGADHVRVYDGSWKEWGNDASNPITK